VAIWATAKRGCPRCSNNPCVGGLRTVPAHVVAPCYNFTWLFSSQQQLKQVNAPQIWIFWLVLV